MAGGVGHPLGEWLAVPNLVTAFRVVGAPVLVVLALQGRATVFLGLLAACFLSDAVDGWLARRCGIHSDLGARIDSWADLMIYLLAPGCVCLLWPGLVVEEAPYIVMMVAAYMVPMVAAVIKFRQFASYHTLGAKLAAALTAGAFFLAVVFDEPRPFRVVACFLILVAMEEVAITVLLERPRSNIPSVWVLLKKPTGGATV